MLPRNMSGGPISSFSVSTALARRRSCASTGKSKPCVWRWQARFMAEGVDGLLRDKTRPSRIPPLGSQVVERVAALDPRADPPAETTHWTAAMMAKQAGIEARCSASGAPTACSRTGSRQFKLSNDPAVRRASCATWSACISIRRPTPSCSRSTRRARSRRSTGPSPACR